MCFSFLQHAESFTGHTWISDIVFRRCLRFWLSQQDVSTAVLSQNIKYVLHPFPALPFPNTISVVFVGRGAGSVTNDPQNDLDVETLFSTTASPVHTMVDEDGTQNGTQNGQQSATRNGSQTDAPNVTQIFPYNIHQAGNKLIETLSMQ